MTADNGRLSGCISLHAVPISNAPDSGHASKASPWTGTPAVPTWAVQEHHDQKVSLKEIQAARNARRRALRRGINERIAIVAAHNTETPPDAEAAAPAPRQKLKLYKEDLR